MNIYYYEVTDHSFKRSKERCSIKNRKAAANVIRHAYARGKRAEDLKSWERDYLSREKYADVTPVAYNDMCYLFSEERKCITVIELPAWFGKKKHFDGKKRIRDYKKYMNNMHCRNDEYDFDEISA